MDGGDVDCMPVGVDTTEGCVCVCVCAYNYHCIL